MKLTKSQLRKLIEASYRPRSPKKERDRLIYALDNVLFSSNISNDVALMNDNGYYYKLYNIYNYTTTGAKHLQIKVYNRQGKLRKMDEAYIEVVNPDSGMMRQVYPARHDNPNNAVKEIFLALSDIS